MPLQWTYDVTQMETVGMVNREVLVQKSGSIVKLIDKLVKEVDFLSNHFFSCIMAVSAI